MDEKGVGWAPGLVIEGKFEVEEQIGLGGMGAVFRVHHREWNLDLAVKVPLPEVVADRENRERYIREAETWIDLGVHPHIVRCWFVKEVKGLPLLFLDYMAGGSLKDWMTTGHVAPGNWELILDLTMQACDGLAYAHSHGVVHRDVKPANLLIRGDERLCVTDFGIVKTTRVEEIAAEFDVSAHQLPEVLPEALRSLSTTLTGQGALLGTPEYGAPEQWGNANEAGPAADVYALGVLLHEMCCGRRPFDDGKRVNPSLLIGKALPRELGWGGPAKKWNPGEYVRLKNGWFSGVNLNLRHHLVEVRTVHTDPLRNGLHLPLTQASSLAVVGAAEVADDCALAIGLRAKPGDNPLATFVYRGETLQVFPARLALAGIEVLICADHLHLDVSGERLVQNEEFTRLWEGAKLEVAALREALRLAYPRVPDPRLGQKAFFDSLSTWKSYLKGEVERAV